MIRPWRLARRPDSFYPERRVVEPGPVDAALLAAWSHAAVRLPPGRRALMRAVRRVLAHEAAMTGLSDTALRETALSLRPALRSEGLDGPAALLALALVREGSARRLGMRHYPVQVAGALALLRGQLAEMATGEGKTITAGLAACVAALAGMPVHVVTVNDYLAARDAGQCRPLYELFGLATGIVQHGQPAEARRAAYAADVTYATNKDIAFDYLRDRLAPGAPPLLRGLHYAIVDEADSVMVDEARTPLIIAAPAAASDTPYDAALKLAGTLRAGEHYQPRPEARGVTLLQAGRTAVEAAAATLEGPLWRVRRAREELATQALAALHMFRRDRDYIIVDGAVCIVDEYTGRVAEGRSWEAGLHQMIETKEGVATTDRDATAARITYQRFFPRYLHLSGMSGTVAERAAELWLVYGLKVVRIPTHRQSRRRRLGVTVFADATVRWDAVLASARAMHDAGRPVLIGTRSVAASELMAGRLAAAGLPHTVLNARQDRAEAETVARAGEARSVTLATNIAGRGTDIRLADGVAEAGGLHVILTEFHESTRIDRQLIGRGARQGDPGTWVAFASLHDDLFRHHAPLLARALQALGSRLPAVAASLLLRSAQHTAERRHRAARRAVLQADRSQDKLLAFAGRPE